MLKSYAGKKILKITEKTTVNFISVASSTYHCFFFLGPPLVMSDGDRRLTLGSLFETTRDPLSGADSFPCESSHSALSS